MQWQCVSGVLNCWVFVRSNGNKTKTKEPKQKQKVTTFQLYPTRIHEWIESASFLLLDTSLDSSLQSTKTIHFDQSRDTHP